jgi:HlyD family secretion protein
MAEHDSSVSPTKDADRRTNLKSGRRILLAGITLAAITAVGVRSLIGESSHQSAQKANHGETSKLRVDVVHPEAGGCARVVELPGTARAFEYANLYARVSGFLKVQGVDIGDQVKKGQLLAELDVPELEQELQRNRAQVGFAEAQLKQKEAAIQTVLADSTVAESMVLQAEAEIGRTTAYESFREKQFNRMKDLRGMKAIDDRLVDEKQDEHESAISAREAAKAKVVTAKAQVAAGAAKVTEARANYDEANARVAVAKADMQKAEVLLKYSKIISPYDGVITARTFHIGDFVQSADQGVRTPILQVQKLDVIRLVVQVPDREVPYTNVGDVAVFKVDGLGSDVRKGQISRLSSSEEERTRTMRTEIDLPNADGKLRDGMYGQVVLHLQEANPNAVHIPSACLVGKSRSGGTKVFVCRDGKLQLVPVQIGNDNGVVVEITEGLTTDQQVVFAPGGDLVDGIAVEPVLKRNAPQ